MGDRGGVIEEVRRYLQDKDSLGKEGRKEGREEGMNEYVGNGRGRGKLKENIQYIHSKYEVYCRSIV